MSIPYAAIVVNRPRHKQQPGSTAATHLPDPEELTRGVLDVSPVVLFTQDRHLRYLWVLAPAGTRLSGAVGLTDAELFPPDAAGRLQEIKSWVLTHGVKRREVVQASFAGDESGFMDIAVFPSHDQAGAIIGVRGIAIDVSDVIITENLMRRSQRRLLLVMENIPGWFLILDPDRRVLFCNSEAARALGRPGEPPVGLKDEDFFTQGSIAAYRPLFERALESGERQRQEILVPCDTGTIPIDLTLVPLLDSQERVIEVVVFGHDLTEQKQNEEKIGRSEATYRLLFEMSPDPVWVCDEALLSFLDVNQAAIQEYGYSREELLAIGPAGLLMEDGRRQFFSVEADEGPARVFAGIGQHRRKDGAVIDVEIKTQQITYDGRPAYIFHIADITTRLQAERVLRESERRFRAIIEGSHQPLLTMDGSGMITAVSQKASLVLGWPAEELTGRNWQMLFHTGFDTVRQQMESTFRGNNRGAKAIVMARIFGKDGLLRWVEWEIALNVGEENIEGYVARVRDLGNPFVP